MLLAALLLTATTAPLGQNGAEPPLEPPHVVFAPNLTPYYPPEALRAETTGLTRLRCTLTATGLLERCELYLSSGTPALDQAAFRVAADMRYAPAKRGGEPVEISVIVPIRWEIQ